MSDAEARAKAEEWMLEHVSVPLGDWTDAFNSLATLLRDAGAGTWSKEKPKAPGPYWLRRPPSRIGFIVDVCGPGRLWWWASRQSAWVDETDGEWSGPIPEPR